MYYRLSYRYLLRGWKKLPYAVVDRATGNATFISAGEMSILNLCDGKMDFAYPIFDDKTRDIVREYCKMGVVVQCEEKEELLPIQKYKLYPSRYVKSAHWSVTGKCNFRCKHCYMSAPDAKLGEISHEEAMSIVDQLAECGVMTVTLTGGECLVRSDFMDIVDRLLEHGIAITTIYTNGALVNEKLLKELDSREVYPEFNMSFDGVDGHHDWLRGIEGASQMVDKAFKLCRDMGFPTGAEMCVHGQNKDTLRDTVNYLSSVGCRSLKMVPISNVGEWAKNGYGTTLTMDELYELYLDYIPKYYEDGMPLSIMLGGFFAADPHDKDIYDIPAYHYPKDPSRCVVCQHARLIMYISPEGRLLPCMSLSASDIQQKFPNILDKGLKSCLDDSYYMDFINTRASKVFEHNRECTDCEYKMYCQGGCRAGGLELSDNSDLMHRDESSCKLFKDGYASKLINLMHDQHPDIKFKFEEDEGFMTLL